MLIKGTAIKLIAMVIITEKALLITNTQAAQERKRCFFVSIQPTEMEKNKRSIIKTESRRA